MLSRSKKSEDSPEETREEDFGGAMELEEVRRTDEPLDLSMVHAFGTPRDPRTMAWLSEPEAKLLAAIDAKGQFTGSPIRKSFVTNALLMSRSVNGRGSEQMVRIAAGQREGRSVTSRFFNWGAGGAKGKQTMTE